MRRRSTGLAALAAFAAMSGCGSEPGKFASADTDTDTDTDTDVDSDSDTDVDTDTDTDADGGMDTDTECTAFPAAPDSPLPVDAAADVDPADTTSLDWGDASDALSYHVYLGDDCPPPAYPDAAFVEVAASALPGATLAYATEYCWQVVASAGPGCDTAGPQWGFHTRAMPSGATCAEAVDVSAGPFPFQIIGDLASDPAVGGSCDVVPNNAAWFTFTPVGSGPYQFLAQNNTSANAYSRIAIFEGLGCDPLGAEVVCAAANRKGVLAFADLVAGTTYTILFYTDGDGFSMVNPEITIGPADSGQVCSAAADVSEADFPYTAAGVFDQDPAAGSTCDAVPTNAAWFLYTPASTHWYEITTINATTTDVWSTQAVFEGASCDPLGAEVDCVLLQYDTAWQQLELDAGTPYLILFHTDGDAFTMVDPQIDVRALGAGELCTEAVDVTGETYPFQLTGTFQHDPAVAPTCDTTPNNAAWFSFTPAVGGTYDITATNATTTMAYSRLAVFDGAACDPPGAEEACVANNALTATASPALAGGTTYTILFYTDGDDWTMVDPEISITGP